MVYVFGMEVIKRGTRGQHTQALVTAKLAREEEAGTRKRPRRFEILLDLADSAILIKVQGIGANHIRHRRAV